MSTNYNELLLKTLDDIPYDDKYKIMFGSLGQLMKGIHVVQDRVSCDHELDGYKKSLYPVLRSLCCDLLDKFKESLHVNSEKEYYIIKYNIFGYDGMIKKEGYSGVPYVAGVNPKTKYGYANFGLLLKVIKQRLVYIATKDTPYRYCNDEDAIEIYNKLKKQCTDLLVHINENIEEKWKNYVDVARKNGGDEVEKNLKKRTEKKEQIRNRNINMQKKNIEQSMKKNLEILNNRNIVYFNKSKITVN